MRDHCFSQVDLLGFVTAWMCYDRRDKELKRRKGSRNALMLYKAEQRAELGTHEQVSAQVLNQYHLNIPGSPVKTQMKLQCLGEQLLPFAYVCIRRGQQTPSVGYPSKGAILEFLGPPPSFFGNYRVM